LTAPEKLVRLLEQIQGASDPPLELLDEFRLAYRQSSRGIRESFFSLLLTRMEVPREPLEGPLAAVLSASTDDPVHWTSLLTDLRRKLESPRMRAFRRFLNASGGLKFLLDLRADVLAAALDLGPIDEEIAYLFTSWFQYGFLFLQEITQDSSYRQIRFLKERDMVHPMASLEEMGNRLGKIAARSPSTTARCPKSPSCSSRRAHPTDPHLHHDPRRFPLGSQRPGGHRDFYSINNAQNGLVDRTAGSCSSTRSSMPSSAIARGADVRDAEPVPGLLNRYLKPILAGATRSSR
jgi:hypothetical protein